MHWRYIKIVQRKKSITFMTSAPWVVNLSDEDSGKVAKDIEQHVHCVVQLESYRDIYHGK